MGWKTFMLRIEAPSPEEGYEILVERFTKSHGDRDTAGTIKTCEYGECKGSFPKYLLYNESKASAIIKGLDGGSEGVADFIDLGHTQWRIQHLMRELKRYTAKTFMKYAVCDDNGEILEPKEDYLFSDKIPADEKAIEAMKAGITKVARVFRTQVVLSGNQEMSVYTWSTPQYRQTKEKPTRGITKNSRVESLHQYIFFGKAKT